MNKKTGYLGGIAFLSKYLYKYKTNFILFFLSGTVEILLSVLMPLLLAVMIDQVIYFRNITIFFRIGFVFIVMTVFSSSLVFVKYSIHSYLMSMFTFDIQMDIFRKLLASKAKYIASYKSGDVITNLLYDSEECLLFVIRNVIHTINNILQGIFFFACIVTIDIRIGMLVAVIIPIASWITLRQQAKVRGTVQKERSYYGTYVSWIFEIIKGLCEVKLLRADGQIHKVFFSSQRRIYNVRQSTKLITFVSTNIIGIVSLFMLLAIFTLCAYLSLIGQLSIGNVIVIVTFATMLNEQIVLSTVKSFLDAQSRLIKIEKLKELLSRDDESEWKGNEDLKVREGKIEFRNVSFSYDDNRKTLDGLSFTIEAGSHFALVGKSGCGKTTIANLLIGLYEIQSGDILIDGNSLYNYNLRSIRQSIGVVQQDIMLFDGSIRSNLLLGDFSATEEELWLACEKAGISEFIDTLEKKLDTLIGPGGIMLSGGQKQRIEIARIYLKNPAIILFDEATSALDSATEKAIHEAWREVLEERTAIVISHRESSVLLCDSVLMIENGKAHIAGVPGELLRQDIGFRALFAMAEGS